MQYILTQQEYDELLNKSNNDLLDKYDKLEKEHQELKFQYAKLLVFGVTANNEKLKGSKCKALS